MSHELLGHVRAQSQERLAKVQSDLSETDKVFADKACVYATGSFGRLEAGSLSDLDLFIVVDVVERDREIQRAIDQVSEIKLKYSLISVAESNELPRFDGGGKFLKTHRIDSYVEHMGSQSDDSENTLTGRLLLLLESKCLLGSTVYKKTILQVTQKYFKDFENHPGDFVPAYLMNDILRMWRTFCVNYEFNRKDGDSRQKIKNLRLKFSRMLTCYSGIIYLLAVSARSQTVSPEDVFEMIALTPTERLMKIADWRLFPEEETNELLHRHIDSALSKYAEFLELAHLPIKESVKRYDKDSSGWRDKSYEFGRSLFDVIGTLGTMNEHANRVHRLVTV
ncbi:MAG: nucleotidyltransferase domain-containing protein [Sandaracinobacter sp.]